MYGVIKQKKMKSNDPQENRDVNQICKLKVVGFVWEFSSDDEDFL